MADKETKGECLKTKVHLFGCQGIQNPVDMHGEAIEVGDKLSWDFGDTFYKDNDRVEDWMKKPIFEVHAHKSGKGLCAKGIEKDFYLHDFRFKYCEKIKNN